jgi:hypothetical protein
LGDDAHPLAPRGGAAPPRTAAIARISASA